LVSGLLVDCLSVGRVAGGGKCTIGVVFALVKGFHHTVIPPPFLVFVLFRFVWLILALLEEVICCISCLLFSSLLLDTGLAPGSLLSLSLPFHFHLSTNQPYTTLPINTRDPRKSIKLNQINQSITRI